MSDEETGGGKPMKVTDKRMFTPDGDLKEEFRFLAQEGRGAEPERPPDEPRTAAEPPAAAAREERRPAEPARAGAAGTSPSGPPLEIPTGGPQASGLSFLDLVMVLAEPISVYLGDAALPDGQTAENLDAARLYIDLLDVLRQKTVGNLTAQEAGVLEDVLYRLRMRYVQKRG